MRASKSLACSLTFAAFWQNAAYADAVAATASPPTTRLFNATDLLRARAALHAGSDAVLTASHTTLLKQANKALTVPMQSVMNKTLSLPGVSSQNYVSIGIYNHPCNNLPEDCKPYPGQDPLPPSECDSATGLPWTPCDGIRNHDAMDAGDSPAQSAMVSAVESLALAAFYEQDPSSTRAFVSKAASFLRTWFLDEDTAMLPNLYYGQIKPSKTPPKKGHGGFIEWTNTASLLDHVELLRFADPQGEAWTDSDHAALHEWFLDFKIYIESPEGKDERSMTNNHGTFYDVTWQSVALSASDKAEELGWPRCARCNECDYHGADEEGSRSLGGGGHTAEECTTACLYDSSCNFAALSSEGNCHLFKTCAVTPITGVGNWTVWATSAALAAQEVNLNRIATQILPNGTEWIEVQRNDGVHYAEYNLQAMTMNADLASSMGAIEVWGFETADGRSLRKALDWMLLYAVGEEKWPYSEETASTWTQLWEPLRRAAGAYGERSYEEAACHILASAGKTNYGSDVMNLRIPPRHSVSCSDPFMV